MIDEILVSNRQGRNVEGFDQLYADPEVKNALQLGNETIARTYIRDKLCSLGLMNVSVFWMDLNKNFDRKKKKKTGKMKYELFTQCDNIEGRRPYYSPHRGIYPQDIIYAQPVTIKPVGRPLPAVPVKRPYAPAIRPPASSSFISSGPPPSEVIYGVGGAPHPPSFVSSSSYPAFKKPGYPSFSSRPVYEAGITNEGFEFAGQLIDKKQIALRPTIGSETVQQHVHHHYHHANGGATIGGVPSSLGYGAGNIGTSYDIPNSGVLGAGFQDLDDYKKAFKVKETTSNDGSVSANSYAERYPVYEKPTRDFETLHGKPDGYKSGKYFSPGNYVSPNAVQSSSNDYVTSGSTSSYYYGNTNNEGFANDFYTEDCVCVPYGQCPREQAGRKDDLFLPIDPRNLNKNIEAESMEETAAMVIEKNTNETFIVGSNDFQTPSQKDEKREEMNKARSKRETTTAGDESANIEGRKKSNGEGVRMFKPCYFVISRS